MAEIRRSLDNEFAMKRDKALFEAERRKQEVMAKIPALSDLDAQIRMAGIRYARALLSDNDEAFSAQALSDEINALNSRREELLAAHNIPADYLEPRFSCPICEDRGYVPQDGAFVPCACYQRLYLEQLYKVSNLLDDGKTGFGHFNENYYSDEPNREKYRSENSPRAQILHIKQQCMEFIDNFCRPETQNLYFFGPTGTGKTFMAKCTGLSLLEKGFTVLYLSSTSLFSIIHQYRISSDRDGSFNEKAYINLINSNLLILDDLGTEPGSDARYAELLTLMELRKARDKTCPAKTIIASNLDFKRLFQEYNERIASRIVGEFQTMQFFGDDIRILKKMGV